MYLKSSMSIFIRHQGINEATTLPIMASPFLYFVLPLLENLKKNILNFCM